MKKVEIFDPALCCSTGVCGPSPEQQMIAFAGLVKSLEGKVEIERYNLAQQPVAFSNNPSVKKILEEEGTEALPVILIDGKLAMKGVYPSKEQMTQLIGKPASDEACCTETDSKSQCCETDDGANACC